MCEVKVVGKKFSNLMLMLGYNESGKSLAKINNIYWQSFLLRMTGSYVFSIKLDFKVES